MQLVSVMDHSPGQREFVLESKYREHYMGKYHLTTTQMDDSITLQIANSRQSARYGMTIAEFPTTVEAARGCKERSSLAPASAAGLDDRGQIAKGLRADLVQARSQDGLPVVQQVWRQAKRVF